MIFRSFEMNLSLVLTTFWQVQLYSTMICTGLSQQMYLTNVSHKCISTNVSHKCISQMYLNKCISTNVSQQMYLNKCVSQWSALLTQTNVSYIITQKKALTYISQVSFYYYIEINRVAHLFLYILWHISVDTAIHSCYT